MRHSRTKMEERKASVLEVIDALTQLNGYPPSYREIGEEVRLAHSAVFNIVKGLRRDGLINEQKDALHSRAITLSDLGRAVAHGRRSADAKPPAV